MRKILLLVFVLLLITGTTRRQSPSPQTSQKQETIKVGVAEVLVDIVARDKKGRPVRDLQAGDFEIHEDGVKQKVNSFRLVEGEAPAAPPEGPVSAKPDPLRHINLVTLVFDRLNVEARQLSKQAAMDFLNTELRQNVPMAVFKIDQRLNVLQQFTNDREALKRAVERATVANYTEFASLSDSIRQTLETATSSQATADATASSAGRNSNPSSSMGSSFAEAKLAEMTLNMLRYSESLQREQQGRSSLFSLLSLVREQRRLSGRKTLIYFSEGLQIPPNLVGFFQSTISEANLSNVSVYAVDARGLTTTREGLAGSEALVGAANASRGQMTRRRGAVTRDEVMIGETAEASIRMHVQGTLADLSENTGGFLVANTNDLRVGMRHVASDISSYYELAYTPEAREYDGKFRHITVKISRPGVTLQTRNGYFALPPTEGTPVFPYEMPMLASLETKTAPRELVCRSASLLFPTRGSKTDVVLHIEIPLSDFAFPIDKAKKEFEAKIDALILLKNSAGHVIEKFGQEIPLRGQQDKAAETQSRNLVFYRNAQLDPGRYTMETVVRDGLSGKTTVKRSVFVVPVRAAKSVALSSIVVVKRLESTRADANLAETPLLINKQVVVPNLDPTVNPKAQPELAFYFVAVPPAEGDAETMVDLIVSKDGKPVGRMGERALPSPDEKGLIRYLASLPLTSLDNGSYDVNVVVRRGALTATGSAAFSIQ